MKIVIPMSGIGKRFIDAGYNAPKPLIPVDGKPIIAHVLDMFPGETDVTFICNEEHLNNQELEMEATLLELCPTANVVSVPQHSAGPVYAVSKIFDQIADDEPVVVNYCDFACYWNYEDFKHFVEETQCDGCIPAYRGFHPHMLGPNNYAFIKETNMWLEDIQEKEPFTDDRSKEYASSGTYYFRTGEILKNYFQKCVEDDLNVNGEYYVSMVYRPMAEAGLKTAVYELQHFMQWGTPEDLAQYQCYSEMFKGLAKSRTTIAPENGTLLMPMAGLGSRYAKEGYELPKPLIPVSGKPMVVQAGTDLPPYTDQVFIVRKDLPMLDDVMDGIKSHLPNARFIVLEELTDGQARTCILGTEGLDPELPVTIGACDNGVIYDHSLYQRYMEDPDTDVIVWVMRGHPGAKQNPQMYGWIDADGDTVKRASVKVPLDNPAKDPIIIGAFTFKKTSDFVRAAEHLFDSDVRVNGEFYVDSLINDAIELGMNCKTLEIEHYPGWGTPDDLRTFEYWQSCFSKWSSHPYTLESDGRLADGIIEQLEKRYQETTSPRPGA